MSLTRSTCRTHYYYLRSSARWKNAKEDNGFPLPTLTKTIQDYQDPAKCDKISQIHTQIDETKEVLVRDLTILTPLSHTIESYN